MNIIFKFKYLKKVNLTVCLFLFCSGLTAQDVWPFNAQQKKDYNAILNGICDYEIIISKNAPASSYLVHLKQTIDLLIYGNESDIEIYEDNLKKQIENITEFEGSSPYQNYYLAEIRLRTAFVYIKFGQHMDAGWQFRQAYKTIQKNIQQYPDFKPQYKTMGLMNVLLGSVSEKYQWVISLAGMEGSITEGVEQLQKTIIEDSIYSKESLVILSMLEAFVLNDVEKANTRIKTLQIDGNLTALSAMSIYLKASQSEQVILLYEKIKEDIKCTTPIHYLAAEAYLQKGAYQNAIEAFETFINDYEGSSNRKDAYYKLYLCYYLSGDVIRSNKYLKQAKNIRDELTEADRYAGKMMALNELPNKEILKIRFAIDGGFNKKAFELIDSEITLRNKKDSIELIYRKARLMHKTNNISAATHYYELVMDSSYAGNWYYAPNSALMLGYIYYDQGDLKKSRAYLQKSIDYRHHDYENSIETKAEALLNVIRDQLSD